MITSSQHSRAFHFAVALLSGGAFLALIHFLPSLAKATETQIEIKAAAEILGTIALLFAVIRFGREPARLYGVRPVRLASLGWGLLCFLAIAVLSVSVIFAFAHFGISQQGATLTALASHPVPIILLLALTAGIAEEIIFRSILITELEFATGSTWIAGAISLAVFAVAHASAWGPWQIVFAAVPGFVLTLFFLWKRDLWVCILAHFLTDAVGLLSAAANLAHHS